MHITKMHGLGNDYIYLNGLKGIPEDLAGASVRRLTWHFGVGGDGLICIQPRTGRRFFHGDVQRGRLPGGHVRQRDPLCGQVRL